MSPVKHSYGSVTDGRTDEWTNDRQSDPYVSLCFAGDRRTDRQTDNGQSDPYLLLCFAGDAKMMYYILILYKPISPTKQTEDRLT